MTKRLENIGKRTNLSSHDTKKFHVCGRCLRTDAPFIVKIDKEGTEAFTKHNKEKHGNA